jgi:hypothetical protein
MMIPFALVAAAVCFGLLTVDLLRRAGDPFVAVRLPIAGVWGMAWLVYGLNPVGFPQPGAETLFVLAVSCLGALLTCPTGYRTSAVVPPRWAERAAAQPVMAAMVVVGALLIAWDLYFVVANVSQHGWTAGLSQHRLDRGAKMGAYGLPGMEVLHAAVTAAGALGFAYWLRFRWRLALVATILGLVAALFSTGRWDVVAYAIWLFAVYGFHVQPSPSLVVKQAVVYAFLPVFFIAHGQLLGKLDLATSLANSTADERAAIARFGVPVVTSGGLSSASEAPAEAPKAVVAPCDRWTSGLADANAGFRRLSRVTRTLVLYMAGPMATLDRGLCEGQVSERTVLFYWPNKILRILGLRAPERLLVVDPFLDIGVPFNNYTVIYQFLAEIGPRLGLVAWLVLALVAGRFSTVMLRTDTASGVVAGTAVLAMAVRTPWTNTFFDGTLVVWLGVASLPFLAPVVFRQSAATSAAREGSSVGLNG